MSPKSTVNNRKSYFPWLAGSLAISLLIAAGAVHRVVAAKYFKGIGDPIELPVPLGKIPLQVADWMGTDVEMRAVTVEYLKTNFADDYINRLYVNSTAGARAGVYVVYCSSRPAGIIGHRPLVCYPGSGWSHDRTDRSEIISSSGRLIPCLIHRFHDDRTYEPVIVLNFYVLNGQITLSEKEFSSVWGRRPNLSGDFARYVAQIQVSADVESSVRFAASEMVDTILAFLPDKDGQQAAAAVDF